MAKTHGHAVNQKVTPELRAWYGIMDRCYRTNYHSFPRYGGRGITVCSRWRKSFENFYADVGPRPSKKHSLERIDNEGPYAPGNVKWATVKEQQRNKRTNRLVIYKGKSMTLVEASEVSGLRYGLIKRRLQMGWIGEQLFDQPLPTGVHR